MTISATGGSLADAIQAKKAALEAQLKALEGFNIEKLLAERDELAVRLSQLDAQIADVRSQLGLSAPKTAGKPAATDGRRTRLGSAEIRNRILRALAEAKHGLSQKEIADSTDIAYGSVAAYLKANAANFRSTGALKGKRYFLR